MQNNSARAREDELLDRLRYSDKVNMEKVKAAADKIKKAEHEKEMQKVVIWRPPESIKKTDWR